MMTNMKIVREGEIRGFHYSTYIKAGDVVTIRKGTIVVKREGIAAKKTYKVKVNHVLPGRSMCVGYYDTTSGKVLLQRFEGKYTDPFARVYGTDKLEDLVFYLVPQADGFGNGRLLNLYLPLENPSVRWAASGLYWAEADINDVLLLPSK